MAYTEFVYPTVVGPRYSGKKTEVSPAEHWIENPYLREGITGNYAFNITTNLNTGLPLEKITSDSHELSIQYTDKGKAKIRLKNPSEFSGDRDYILRYQLKGASIHSGLLTYEGEEENFFLMMMQPPKRIQMEKIPPREYIYVLDISGSMYGFPLETSKQLMRNLLGNLREEDSFNILLFAGGSSLFSEVSLKATPENINSAMSFVDRQRGGGGTELKSALKRALALPRDENTSRNIIIATDGYISLERDVFELIRDNLDNANIFPFGIGSSVNRFLIEGIARAGYGEAFVITKPNKAQSIVSKFQKYIETPVLSNVKINYGDLDVFDIEPRTIPDILAERPLVIFGKWRGELEGELTISGFQADEHYSKTIALDKHSSDKDNEAIRYLWARNRIAELSDYNFLRANQELREEITELGLNYNLLTKYTSFVAIDEQIRNLGGEQKDIKQPLPLPKGVSNLAVGSSIPVAPEPEVWAMLIILSLIFGYTAIQTKKEKIQKDRIRKVR